MLVECGARRGAAEAARELRSLGGKVAPDRRPRRAITPARIESLSRREREVADLVAEGHTNRQIAAALYLSERTIETYLHNIFAKLGVPTRSAVASVMTRHTTK